MYKAAVKRVRGSVGVETVYKRARIIRFVLFMLFVESVFC